jgi:hypothetical protein
MPNAAILERLAELPRELAADVNICYVEATSPETIAACNAHRKAKQEGMERFFELARTLGAASFFVPSGVGYEPKRPRNFTFETPPNKRAWTASKMRVAPGTKGTPFHPSKHPEGKAITAQIEAVEPIPNDNDIIDLLGAPDTIRYKTGDEGSGMTTVSGGNGGLFFAAFGFVGEHNFVVFPNPFKTISDLASSDSDFYKNLELEPSEVLDWRPPEGWTLITKAQFDLKVAQFRASQEAKAA